MLWCRIWLFFYFFLILLYDSCFIAVAYFWLLLLFFFQWLNFVLDHISWCNYVTFKWIIVGLLWVIIYTFKWWGWLLVVLSQCSSSLLNNDNKISFNICFVLVIIVSRSRFHSSEQVSFLNCISRTSTRTKIVLFS